MPQSTPFSFVIRIPYLITLLGLGIRAAAASIVPEVLGTDPWHQLLVLGAGAPLAPPTPPPRTFA